MTSSNPVYLSAIFLEHIRGFRKARFDLSDCTVVIGRNGTCKSTLLRALALSLSPYSEIPALLNFPFGGVITTDCPLASIIAKYRSGNGDSCSRKIPLMHGLGARGNWVDGLTSVSKKITESLPFFCAYGAGRFHAGSGPGNNEPSHTDAAAGLFNMPTTLADPELTLRRLRDFAGSEGYKRQIVQLKRLLDLSENDRFQIRSGGGIELEGPSTGGLIPLQAWADGYRVTFTWLLDFFAWAMRADAFDAEGNIEGVLIVDEIEQHLHPSMQAKILPKLRRLLPKVQIIVTTHSPLVTLGVRPEQIVSLKRIDNGEVVRVPAPEMSRFSAEDVLTDERLFDTSALSPAATELTKEYDDLVRVQPQARSAQQHERVRQLAAEFAPKDGKLSQEAIEAELSRLGLNQD